MADYSTTFSNMGSFIDIQCHVTLGKDYIDAQVDKIITVNAASMGSAYNVGQTIQYYGATGVENALITGVSGSTNITIDGAVYESAFKKVRFFFDRGALCAFGFAERPHSLFEDNLSTTEYNATVATTTDMERIEPETGLFYRKISVDLAISYCNRDEHLISELISLASKKGIDGLMPMTTEHVTHYAPEGSLKHHYNLMRMQYPTFREIADTIGPEETMKLTNGWHIFTDCNRGLSFHETVEKYFGKTTDKLLNTIWENLILVQKNVDQRQIPPVETYKHSLFAMAFNLGPQILKHLGWDYLYHFLENPRKCRSSYGYPVENDSLIPKLLFYFSPRKVVKILGHHDLSQILDIAHMLSDINDLNTENSKVLPDEILAIFPEGLKPPKKWKDTQELHDKIARDHRKIKALMSRIDFDYHPLFLSLDGRAHGDHKIVIPKNSIDLTEIGEALHNCIAGYSDRVMKHKTLVVGVEVNGALTYAIEFDHHSDHEESHKLIPFLNVERQLNGEENRVQQMLAENLKDFKPIYKVSASGSYRQFRSDRNADVPVAERAAVDRILSDWYLQNEEAVAKIFARTSTPGVASTGNNYRIPIANMAVAGGNFYNVAVNNAL